MSKIIRLVEGEMVRLYKNKILPVSLFVTLLWIFIIAFSTREEIQGLLPAILVIDSAMLSIIYLAAAFYLERQEGAIKSLFVSPLTSKEIIISKIISTIITSLISTIVIILTFLLVHKAEVNLFLLIVYTILIVFTHSAIGFVIVLNCRDFAQMLGLYAAYAILFFLPTVFFLLQIIPDSWEVLLLASPTHSSMLLLQSAILEAELLFELVAFFYLLILGSLYLYFM